MFGKKKKFKVTVTMNACFAEDTLYYCLDEYARSAEQLFKRLKRKKWIRYTTITKLNGIESTRYAYIQRSNIADIYISEVVK